MFLNFIQEGSLSVYSRNKHVITVKPNITLSFPGTNEDATEERLIR